MGPLVSLRREQVTLRMPNEECDEADDERTRAPAGWPVGRGPCCAGSGLRSLGRVGAGQARSWRPAPPVASAGPGPVVFGAV